MGTLDSREYDRLKERNFHDYSEGHRHMYLSAIRQIATEAKPVSIFEAGFGIGYGLGKMQEAGIVGRYVGCEPQVDSFNYTAKRFSDAEQAGLNYTLIHAPFSDDLVNTHGADFEHVFCIEVIEHLTLDRHAEFIANLRAMLVPGGTLWLSTPCKRRNAREGVRTTEDWEAMLCAEFQHVDVDRSRWTYLYRCR